MWRGQHELVFNSVSTIIYQLQCRGKDEVQRATQQQLTHSVFQNFTTANRSNVECWFCLVCQKLWITQLIKQITSTAKEKTKEIRESLTRTTISVAFHKMHRSTDQAWKSCVWWTTLQRLFARWSRLTCAAAVSFCVLYIYIIVSRVKNKWGLGA